LGGTRTSADFAVDVAENWQREYPQLPLYILLTVWLLQKGSPDPTSSTGRDAPAPSVEDRGMSECH
jgi:hypothetical protein